MALFDDLKDKYSQVLSKSKQGLSNLLDRTDLDERASKAYRTTQMNLRAMGDNLTHNENLSRAYKSWLDKPSNTFFKNPRKGLSNIGETANRIFGGAQAELGRVATTGMRNAVGDAVRTANRLPGAVTQGITYGVVNPLKKYSPQSTLESVGDVVGNMVGFSKSPLTKSINRVTDPLVSKGVRSLSPKLAPVAGALAPRVVGSVGNVAQGFAFDAAQRQLPTATSVGIDAITGLAMGPNLYDDQLRGSAKGFEFGRNRGNAKWAPQDLGTLDELGDAIRDRKLDQGQLDNLDKVASDLANGYLPQAQIDKIANDYGSNQKGFVKAIVKELQKTTKDVTTKASYTDNLVFGIADNNVYNSEIANNATSKKTLRKVMLRDESKARKDFDQWQKSVYGDVGTRSTSKAIDTITKNIEQNTRASISGVDNTKDISNLSKGFNTVYRNFQKVYGDRYPEVKKAILDPFDQSKGAHVDTLNKLADDLDRNIVSGLKINKGSKESAAVQLFGEGKVNERDLISQFGEKRAADIVKADQWFRQTYDGLLDEVNAVRKQIYPNNPDKIIPKRQDYYRHFREMKEGFGALVNIFDQPAKIAPGLESISEHVKPKSKWLSFAQKRIGDKTDIDAVGGFIDYAQSASYAKNIDPHIDRFRKLRDEIISQTEDVSGENYGQLNNFVNYLDKFSNDLSGKTNQVDRVFQEFVPGGRTTFRAINWLNNRVKSNVILGNVSSSLSQVLNLPQGIASAGKYNVQGTGRTLASIFTENQPMKQSTFIKERYNSDAFSKFDKSLLNTPKKFAVWMTGVLDEAATKQIWNSHYEKALAEGAQSPIKYADEITRNLVGGRGIGEVPLVQKAKVFQLIAPFQLEVGNLWYVMKDMVDKKQFGKIATFFVASHVFNKGLEAIRGSGGAFDPIQAFVDASEIMTEEDGENKTLRATGRVAGEFLSNLPLGQTAAVAYPEYGFKVGDTQLPTREEFFGDADPTRFGSGLLAMKGLQDPLYKVLPAYGGNQIKKTVEGLTAYNNGYSETKSGRVRFPVDQTGSNAVKSTLFGQYSTSNAREYFDAESSPLGDNQSETFTGLLKSEPQKALAYYNSILGKRDDKKAGDLVMATAQVYANENNPLPEESSMLGVLYKKGQGIVDGYEEDKLLIEQDPLLTYDEKVDKLEDLSSKYAGWSSIVERIEREKPEEVISIEIASYGSGGNKSTEERSAWVYEKLSKMPLGEKKVEFVRSLLEEGVIKKTVMEELRDVYGVNIPAYNYNGSIKVASSGGKKKSLPKNLIKPVRYQLPKSSSSSRPRRKITRIKSAPAPKLTAKQVVQI